MKSAAYGGAFTVTTGPFLGGTMATGTGQGDLVGVTMPRLLPSANAGFTVSLDFRATAVAATRLTCIFPSPCTTNVPGIAAAARRGALPEQLRTQLPWVAARRNAAALRH